jgi:ubiquinone/menaquinone biosynthesis C-methylase UbiE
MNDDAAELKRRYETLGKTLDYNTTACDYQLRELEIDTAAGYMRDGQRTLDVGCGLGYACIQYAARSAVDAHGIDYSESMIQGAERLLEEHKPILKGSVSFRHASVLDLPYPEGYFDVVSSSRCLMALLDWELQKQALVNIHRVLQPGGILALMEGTFEGLDALNEMREKFSLAPIPSDGRDRLITLKFHEEQLLSFCRPFFHLERVQRFGMYYFLTRIVEPLLVAPDSPRYDHKLNEVARSIARVVPDFEGIGHLVAFILVKRS